MTALSNSDPSVDHSLDLPVALLSLLLVGGSFGTIAMGSFPVVAGYFFMMTVILPWKPLRIARKGLMAAVCALMVALAAGGFGAVVALAYRDVFETNPLAFALTVLQANLLLAYAFAVASVSFRATFMPPEAKNTVAWHEGRE